MISSCVAAFLRTRGGAELNRAIPQFSPALAHLSQNSAIYRLFVYDLIKGSNKKFTLVLRKTEIKLGHFPIGRSDSAQHTGAI